jgi:hypothetical protein
MKEIKAFITNDSFIDNSINIVSPLYELSDIALSYSKTKQSYYSTDNALYSLQLFRATDLTSLTQTEVNSIINTVINLGNFLTTTQLTNKQQIIISFMNEYNVINLGRQISNLTFNNTIDINSVRLVDYLSFTVEGINCEIWLSDSIFRTFYPHYDISIILPFDNFNTIVNNTSNFIAALDSFDPLEFNARIEENKNNNPTTYTKMLNIQYKVPNTSIVKNCYFAFNIYGIQGNYDYILKLELYNYLINTVGMLGTVVEELFPAILNINEFFITPRWDKIGIPSQVGQASINSQIVSVFNETFDMNKFIKVYTDLTFLRNNTYAVPFDYNNITLYITNGFYSEAAIKDFKTVFNDFLTVTSTHPDFARMKLETQRLVTLLESMLVVSNCNNSTELFNNLLTNSNYRFTIINRDGVDYLSYFYDKHQFYILPKYQFLNLI